MACHDAHVTRCTQCRMHIFTCIHPHTTTCMFCVALNRAVNMPSISLLTGAAMLRSRGQKQAEEGGLDNGVWTLGRPKEHNEHGE